MAFLAAAVACNRHPPAQQVQVEDKRETKCLEEVQVRLSVCTNECIEKVKQIQGLHIHGHSADDQAQAKREMMERALKEKAEMKESFRHSKDCQGKIKIETRIVKPQSDETTGIEEISAGSFCIR